jgi:hypothetical protein
LIAQRDEVSDAPDWVTYAPTEDQARSETYFEFQVEKPAIMPKGRPQPTYPSALESSGIGGEVEAQFVVRNTGKVDMDTFKAIKSTNQLFTDAVRNFLPRMQFSPAIIGGKSVNQLVQQSFQFADDVQSRHPVDVPEHFIPDKTHVTNQHSPEAAPICPQVFTDPRDGTRLHLWQELEESRGDYLTPPRRYGTRDDEVLRLNCRTGQTIGVVRVRRLGPD